MTRLSRIALVAAALGLISTGAFAKVFSPVTRTLDNGLQVVVVENHRSAIVTQMVWYKVGSADEVPGKTGLAHFLEHLMFKGTPSVPPGQFSRILARVGGHDNAFTSSDYTAYYETLAADQLELAMRLESDRMHNLILGEHDVETELKVVEEERRMRTDNQPEGLLIEGMDAALFQNHPYHHPTIGWAHEIAGLTRQDALDFYRRWYAPDNAIVVVAGDVDPEKVFAMAQTYYGGIPKAGTPERHRLAEPPGTAARRLSIKDGRVESPQIIRLYLAPSAHLSDAALGDAKSVAALDVLAEILGGGAQSRLNRTVVIGQALAAGASAWYHSDAWDYGTFGISATPRVGVGLDKLEAALDAQIAQLVDKGVTEDEVTKAKDRLTAGTVYARDSVQSAARALGAALAVGQRIDDVENWPDRIQAVTAADVNAALAKVLVPAHSVTGTLLPDAAARKAGGPVAPPTIPTGEVR